MGHEKRVRVVKREQRNQAAVAADAPVAPAGGAAREAKAVVSSWVREHQRRSEEFRRNYSTLLSELGLSAPWAGKGAFASPAVATGK